VLPPRVDQEPARLVPANDIEADHPPHVPVEEDVHDAAELDASHEHRQREQLVSGTARHFSPILPAGR
jgi:hypothetical protein